MAILWMDSFDDRQGATGNAVATKYATADCSNGSIAIQNTAPTRTGYYVYFPSGTGAFYLEAGFSSVATVIAGVGLYCPVIGGSDTFLKVMDGTTVQVSVRLNTDGTFSVLNGSGAVLGTTTTTFTPGVSFVYVELKVTINATTGTVVLNLNGSAALSLSNQNTQNSGNAFATGVRLTGATNTNFSYDDFYVADTSGSVNNDMIGNAKIECLLPSGAGTTTQFSPTGAGSNYGAVNETLPNDDTSYVASSTPNQLDSYAYTDLSSPSVVVKAVAVNLRARKDDVLPRVAAPVVRHGGTNYVGANITLTNSYVTTQTRYETNPGTGAAWVGTDVNADEFGVKLIS